MALLSKNCQVSESSVSTRTSSKKEVPQQLNVLVKWNEGKTFCLQVDPRTSVAELAASIWEHALLQTTNAMSRDVCMVCRGKVLDPSDDRALREIVGCSMMIPVQVWTRQRGGCFMVSFSILGIIMAAIVGSTCTCGLSLLIVPLLLPLLFILPLFCL
eukprot:scaffold3069_cov215-Amphora_coffeaeformis.AAC.12